MAPLNPYAQEWEQPAFHQYAPSSDLIIAQPPPPPPPPPCAVFPAVVFFAPPPHPPYHDPTWHLLPVVAFFASPPPPTSPPEMNASPQPTSRGEEQNMGSARKPRFSPGGRKPNCSERVGRRAAPKQRWVWRPKNAEAGASASTPPQDSALKLKTTVMIRNIPNQLRRDDLLIFLDDCCKELSLEYDFVYLPMDFRSEDNLGYAFVNFTNAEAAVKFKKALNHYKWGRIETARGRYATNKICEVTWATIQKKRIERYELDVSRSDLTQLKGKELMKKFQHTVFSCDKSEFLPVEFDPPRNGFNAHLSPPKVVGVLRRRT